MMKLLGDKTGAGEHLKGVFTVTLTLLILVMDFYIPSTLNVSVFYFIPISLAVWHGLNRLAVVLATLSVLGWLILELVFHPNSSLPVAPYWNAGVRVASFGFVMALAFRLKAKLDDAEQRAAIDGLTQLLNRTAFHTALELELLKSKENPITVAFLDLDNFKVVNDSWGHTTGDILLRRVAQALQESTRQSDVVARVGGDEFALMLPATTQAQAQPIVERIHAHVLSVMSGHEWPVTISIGVATFHATTLPVTDVLKVADEVMYSVKSDGKNRIAYTTAT